MRATESHDTVLDGAFLPDEDVLCVVPAGPPTEPAVLGVMIGWALTLISNVYVGIAERALEIAIADATHKTSIAIPAGTFAHHPLVQQQVAHMHLELDAARAVLDRLAADWVEGVDHGARWPVQIFAAKWRAATAAMTSRRRGVRGGGRQLVPPRPRARTLLPRRARRSLPPRHRRVHTRDHRQSPPGHQPRRAPLVDATHPCGPTAGAMFGPAGRRR